MEWKDQDLSDPPQVFGHHSCLGCCSTMRWSDRPSPSSLGVSPGFRVTRRLWRLAVEIQQTDAYSGELTSLEPRADSSTSRAPVRETGVKERAKDGWRKSGSRFKQCKVKIMAQLPWQRCALGGRNPWLLTPSRSPRAPSQDNYPPKFLSFQHSLLIPLPRTTSCIVRWFMFCCFRSCWTSSLLCNCNSTCEE